MDAARHGPRGHAGQKRRPRLRRQRAAGERALSVPLRLARDDPRAIGAVVQPDRVRRRFDLPQRPIADAGLHTAEAVAAGTIIGSFLKSTTGRARPRAANGDSYDFRVGKGYTSGDYRSFPSLHEIGSFSAAAAITAEVARHAPIAGRVVGVLAYGTAGAVGMSRMYGGEHWASDVVLGSAIGVFLGKRIVDHAHSGPPSKADRFLLGGLALTPTGASLKLYDRDF
jgi:hypothetical protein